MNATVHSQDWLMNNMWHSVIGHCVHVFHTHTVLYTIIQSQENFVGPKLFNQISILIMLLIYELTSMDTLQPYTSRNQNLEG